MRCLGLEKDIACVSGGCVAGAADAADAHTHVVLLYFHKYILYTNFSVFGEKYHSSLSLFNKNVLEQPAAADTVLGLQSN